MDWLFREDRYEPGSDSLKFIDKSLMSILKILSKIDRLGGQRRGILYGVTPPLKLISTILTVVCVSTSRDATFLLSAGLFVLINLIMLEKSDRKRVLALGITASSFSAVMLIPSMATGNIINSLIIVYKVLLTVSMANILSVSTGWFDVSASLKLLLIPDIFILVLEITLKYIYLLGEISLNMLTALKIRSIGKNNNKYSSISALMGNLFLKSKEMGEELYSAMECRGFTGEYKRVLAFNISRIDAVYAIIVLALTAAYF
ncbi:energy-coupling factor transporter transmembrane component T family protein [Fonticella tunisiensis]|uniref:Cobalt/nickel transport system permease protein n=1 Tax=Fonticella tunisiensis TaxID=1096341 RepID=A0A4R7KS46_9CLOT|nr:energy-coupling factor transporter transmembrane component T [Fonticella tunisiensis]TDT62330.1 cobalt/nickel transport system permease protein [Fonticella tunisiensis]